LPFSVESETDGVDRVRDLIEHCEEASYFRGRAVDQ